MLVYSFILKLSHIVYIRTKACLSHAPMFVVEDGNVIPADAPNKLWYS